MDLSIKLSLDDAQLAAQAQEAAGKLAAVAKGAAAGAQNLAAGANAAAAANQNLAAAVRQAHGGLGVINGAANMATGNLLGMAGGAVQAANGFKMLGASIQFAMRATVVLAVVGGTIQAIRGMLKAAADQAARFAEQDFSALEGATKRLEEHFSDLQRSIRNLLDLQNELAGIDSESGHIERERELLQLEKERAEALAAARRSGGDEAAVNRDFDSRRRLIEHQGRRDDAQARADEIERRLEANAESMRANYAEQNELSAARDAQDAQAKANDAIGNDNAAAKNREESARLDARLKELRDQANALDNERRTLEGALKNASARVDLEEALHEVEELKNGLDDAAKAARKLEEQKQTALREAAEAAARAWRAANAELERSIDLTHGLGGAAAEASRIERDRKLAELERDRQAALAGGGDTDAINREFDERRRTLEFSFEREDSAGAAAALRQEVADNEKRIASLQEALAAAEKAQEAGKIASLEDQIARLQDRNQVLSARAEAEEGRAAVIDLREEAEKLAAETAAAAAAAAKDGQGAASGISGALHVQTDRLTRIGGFTGGGAPSGRQDEALREARESRKLLERIARAAETPGGTVLKLL